MILFVYFDVGGVAIQDFSGTNKWAEMKKRIGIIPEHEEKFNVFWKQYRERICLDFDVDNLIPIIEKEFRVLFPTDYSMLQDFVDHFDPNPSIWPVIEKIEKTSRVGLLTNMYPRMLQSIQARNILPSAKWDVIVDSSVEGYRKPDKKIFEIAEKRASINHNEILFVENGVEIVQAASEFGWQTFLYDSKNPEKSSKELMKKFR